ncbi:hypothetical protein GQ600_26210 [Phytophthora cactorum]|nr:hypothetical protein GQ600_26210 [Phytophthora cactorum]
MNLVNELVEGRFEGWSPRAEPILGKSVSNLERICGFGGVGDVWNDHYASICLAFSKMSRSTFFWTRDLASDFTNVLIRDNRLEPGMSRLRPESTTCKWLQREKEAFDELIDRLRWIFNAVAMTRNQSLLPLTGLKRLNECFSTLGCIHLERLLVVMRQVMYLRIDYACVSKRTTDSLLGLFPHDKRTRFVYPDGCRHAS